VWLAVRNGCATPRRSGSPPLRTVPRDGGAVRDFAVIVPTRGRPANIHKVLQAWDDTDAWTDAQLVLAIDADDINYGDYVKIIERSEERRVGKEWRYL